MKFFPNVFQIFYYIIDMQIETQKTVGFIGSDLTNKK